MLLSGRIYVVVVAAWESESQINYTIASTARNEVSSRRFNRKRSSRGPSRNLIRLAFSVRTAFLLPTPHNWQWQLDHVIVDDSGHPRNGQPSNLPTMPPSTGSISLLRVRSIPRPFSTARPLSTSSLVRQEFHQPYVVGKPSSERPLVRFFPLFSFLLSFRITHPHLCYSHPLSLLLTLDLGRHSSYNLWSDSRRRRSVHLCAAGVGTYVPNHCNVDGSNDQDRRTTIHRRSYRIFSGDNLGNDATQRDRRLGQQG